jgi:hypothetical protein
MDRLRQNDLNGHVKHMWLPFQWQLTQTSNDLCTSIYCVSPGCIPEGRGFDWCSKTRSNSDCVILFTRVTTLRLLSFRLLHERTLGLSLSNCEIRRLLETSSWINCCENSVCFLKPNETYQTQSEISFKFVNKVRFQVGDHPSLKTRWIPINSDCDGDRLQLSSRLISRRISHIIEFIPV